MPRTLHLPDPLYEALARQAERLGVTPEQALERLLAADLAQGRDRPDAGEDGLPPPDSDAARAAVRRLTGLFADLALTDLDAVLDDPMLALANADLDDERR